MGAQPKKETLISMQNKYKSMESLKSLLYRSFDDELKLDEQKALDEALLRSNDLRKEKESIEVMRGILGNKQSHFSDGFSDRLMSKIETQNNLFVIGLFNLFKRFAITGIAAIIVFLISIYFIDGSLDEDSIYGITSYVPEEADFTFFEID